MSSHDELFLTLLRFFVSVLFYLRYGLWLSEHVWSGLSKQYFALSAAVAHRLVRLFTFFVGREQPLERRGKVCFAFIFQVFSNSLRIGDAVVSTVLESSHRHACYVVRLDAFVVDRRLACAESQIVSPIRLMDGRFGFPEVFEIVSLRYR